MWQTHGNDTINLFLFIKQPAFFFDRSTLFPVMNGSLMYRFQTQWTKFVRHETWSAIGTCEISGLDCQLAKRPLGGGHRRALNLCWHSHLGSSVLPSSQLGLWIYYVYLNSSKSPLPITSIQSDSQLYLCIMCIYYCYWYINVLLFWPVSVAARS